MVETPGSQPESDPKPLTEEEFAELQAEWERNQLEHEAFIQKFSIVVEQPAYEESFKKYARACIEDLISADFSEEKRQRIAEALDAGGVLAHTDILADAMDLERGGDTCVMLETMMRSLIKKARENGDEEFEIVVDELNQALGFDMIVPE